MTVGAPARGRQIFAGEPGRVFRGRIRDNGTFRVESEGNVFEGGIIEGTRIMGTFTTAEGGYLLVAGRIRL